MKKRTVFAKASILLPLLSATAVAAPGKLEKQPLFLGAQVQPNILLIIDDSGSMNWEVLRWDGSSPNSGHRTLDFTPGNDEDKLGLCSGYNVLAYNPENTYTPWVGLDSASTPMPYTDMTLAAARSNPFYTATTNISGHFYFPWNDANNNERYDAGECPIADGDRVEVNTLSDEQQTNYANWYSYYRKREYVAKKALSEIIAESSSRMGLATLHNNNSVGTIVENIDDITTPVDEDNRQNKLALAENLFRIDSKDDTPLRRTLEDAGQYFEVGVNPGNGLFGFTPDPRSPILPADEGGQCQQNYSILMSDGNWNGGAPSVGNADAENADTLNPFDGGSHADTYSNTLADVAMYYYKRDLAPDLEDKVGTISKVDENVAQHMVTYTVAFGVNGTLSANPPNREDAFTWPEPKSGQATTIDDMRHAAWNGRGEFLSAADADQLISSLKQAIGGIAKREGAASSVAFNSTSLRVDDTTGNSNTLVFQARFTSNGWSGRFSAFEFDSDGVGKLKWDAADILDARDLDAPGNARQIITHNGTKGVPFSFPTDHNNRGNGDLSEAQIADLLTNSATAIATAAGITVPGPSPGTSIALTLTEKEYGDAIVSYLRGDSGEGDILFAEGGPLFRDRTGNRLGDIVNSSPFFVGLPNARYPNAIEGTGDKLYSEFIKKQSGLNGTPAKRKSVVYVGANDGMLHAFDGVTGEELMAYIPGTLFSNSEGEGLHALAETDYTHQPYVDGSPVAADVYVNNEWVTYLVGGYRAGGKGVYVLDVTRPERLTENNAENIVKAEFTHPQLGHTFSRPQIGKLNNGRWAAIFGNGYNDDPTGDGQAKLFILYLDTFDVEILSTGVGSMVDTDCSNVNSDCNGLSSPTILDITGDGVIDRVYAGDLHGNMWVFDISAKNPDGDTNGPGPWGVASKTAAGESVPLFTACTGDLPCSEANRQPITSKPVVAVHPKQRRFSTEPNLMVYFGTGQFIAKNDSFSTATQSMYGVWDAGADNAGLSRSNLQVQLISDSPTEANARNLSSNTVNYGPVATTGAELGWYMDLPDAGERMVVDPIVVGDLVFFSTLIPDPTICNFGGLGFLMFVDRISGGQPDFTVADLDNDGDFDDEIVAGKALDAIPSSPRFIDDKIVISDSSGKLQSIGVQTGPGRPSRRASWTIVK